MVESQNNKGNAKCREDCEPEVFSLFSEDLMESIRLVMELPNYVLAFDDAGFPLTSSNVGTIKFEEGVLKIGCQLRSNLNDLSARERPL